MPSDLMTELTSEAAERWAEQSVTKAISESRASRHSIFASIRNLLTSVLNPSSTYMIEGTAKASAIGKIAEYGPVIAATALGSIFKRPSFWAKILPGDDSQFVARIKKWAPMILPGLVIGTAEALSDAVTRQMAGFAHQINADAVAIDDLVWWPRIPELVFVPQRDADGLIRYQDSATMCFPVVVSAIPESPDAVVRYYREAETWLAEHLRTHQVNEQTGKKGKDGKPQQTSKTVTVAPSRPVVFVKREDIPQFVRATITPAQAEALLNMGKKKEWTEAIGAQPRRLFIFLSNSMPGKLYGLYEDFFKDIPGYAGIALLQDLAEYWVPKAVNDEFTADQMAKIVAAFDAFMGAGLTMTTRAKFWIAKALDARHSPIWTKAKTIGYLFLSVAIVLTMVMITLFVGGFAAVVQGTITPCDQPFRILLVFTAVEAGRAGPFGLLFYGTMIMTVLLFFLRPIQSILQLLPGGSGINALVDFGWRFTFVLLPVTVICLGILCFGSPLWIRAVLLLLTLMNLQRGMGWKMLGMDGEALLLGARGVRHGATVFAAILLVEWLVRGAPLNNGVSAFHGALGLFSEEVQTWIGDHWVLAMALITVSLAVFCVFLGWALTKMFKTDLWWIAAVVWLLLTIGIGYDRYNSAKKAEPAPSTTATAVTPVPVSAAVPTPVAPTPTPVVVAPPVAPAPVVAPKVIYRRAGGSGSRHSGVNCANLSFEGRQAAGCN